MIRPRALSVLTLLAVMPALAACGGSDADPAGEEESAPAAAQTVAQAYPDPEPDVPEGAHVVEIVAEDYAFEAPEQIESGWTTLRFRNGGEETHFVYVTRLPEGQTYDDYVAEVGQAINEVWYRMRDEGLEKGAALEELGPAVPGWYWTGAETFGGPGMVVPGGVSQVTVELEPGSYVLECFMKTADGEFHWVEGMIRPIEVLEDRSDAGEPEAGVRLTLDGEGIHQEGTPVAGSNTVALTFAAQPEVGFGNDVHVVRLDDGMTPESLVPWMDAFNLEGLQNPAPAPFVGGSHERKAGNTVYFSVDLRPGRYAWITENSDMGGGLFQEFTVQ